MIVDEVTAIVSEIEDSNHNATRRFLMLACRAFDLRLR